MPEYLSNIDNQLADSARVDSLLLKIKSSGVDPIIVNGDSLKKAREMSAAVARYIQLRAVTGHRVATAARFVLSTSPEVTSALVDDKTPDPVYRGIGKLILTAADSINTVKVTDEELLYGDKRGRLQGSLYLDQNAIQAILTAHAFMQDPDKKAVVDSVLRADYIEPCPELPVLLMVKLLARVGFGPEVASKYRALTGFDS